MAGFMLLLPENSTTLEQHVHCQCLLSNIMDGYGFFPVLLETTIGLMVFKFLVLERAKYRRWSKALSRKRCTD